ncbi:MAG: metal-dependent hydrolase [bacterium]
MTLITHTAVGLGLSSFFPPSDRWFVIAFSLLPDIDHLLTLKSWRIRPGGLRASRTVMHELLGATTYTILGLLLYLWAPHIARLFLLSVSVHLFLDFISGFSQPYRMIKGEGSKIDLGENLWIRIGQEVGVSGLFLWMFL